LAVRQPWASLIIEGLKTIEVRSRPTKIRERVAIYASKDQKWLNKNMWYRVQLASELKDNPNYDPSKKLEFGKIIGTVEIESCQYFSYSDFQATYKKHLSPYPFMDDYEWILKNPIKFSSPIPHTPPKGAVVWSKTQLPEGI
jgi:hypothetical protein